eukprot:jgi/Botrbrau1/16179/Bobra.0244s0003.1
MILHSTSFLGGGLVIDRCQLKLPQSLLVDVCLRSSLKRLKTWHNETHWQAPWRTLAASETILIGSESPDPKVEVSAGAHYDWQRQWYPVAYIQDLDTGRPHPLELLGKRLVVWRDSRGVWNCFQDRCPHRLAPLSEGRIDSNGTTLMCSYHGWEFNDKGKCAKIPQIKDPKAHEVACGSSRSCVAVHPTQVKQGMLWIWGDASPTAFLDSALRQPVLLPELDPDDPDRAADGSKVFEFGRRYTRDFDYSWAILVENITDASHVPFAHHGVQGSRYSPTAGDVEMIPTPEGDSTILTPDSISMEGRVMAPGGQINIKVQFTPPCLVRYFTPVMEDDKMVHWSQMPMYVVPVGPGRSRILWSFLVPGSRKLPPLFRILATLKPAWADHLTRNAVFDGDGMMLHVAERLLAAEAVQKGTPQAWRQSYYMPAPADRVVSALRQWLDARGGPPTPDSQLGPIHWDKRRHLDRWIQHTRHCSTCLKALKTLQAVRVAAAVAAVVGVLGAVYAIASPALRSLPVVAIGCAAGTALFGLLWAQVGSLIRQFYYVPYSHQDHN